MPQAAISAGLAKYDGLEMAFSSSKVQHFKVRLADDRADARFIAAVKVNGDGEHNLWLKWSDFHGEELMMRGIKPCSDTAPCRNINHGNINSVAILIPMRQDQAYEESTFTVKKVTLDLLARGGQDSTQSTEVRPSSEAEEIRFEDPDVLITGSGLRGVFWTSLLSLGFIHLL